MDITRLEGETIVGGQIDDAFTLVINGEPIALDGEIGEGDLDDALEDAINAVAQTTRITVTKTTVPVDGAVSTRLVLEAADGRNIAVETSPAAARITGLQTGTARGAIILDHDAPIVVSGPNAVAAGLAVGESVADPSRWRITARRVFCGAKGEL